MGRFREYTEQFIREFYSFATSIYNTLEMWDRHVVYRSKTTRSRPRLQPGAPHRPNSIQTPTPRAHQSNSSESDVEEVRPRNSLNPPVNPRSDPEPRQLIVLSSDDDLPPDAPTPPRPTRPLSPNQPSTSASVLTSDR